MSKELQTLESIAREMETIPGHLGFYYKNLVTGLEFGVHSEESFLAASVIKFPLFLHILQQGAAGEVDLTQVLTVTEKMPSCGALTLFTENISVDIATLCRLMIVLSDNTATNMLIRFCGIPETNQAFRAMGLEKTVLRRLLFDAEAAGRGMENTICPKEMGRLLEQLYHGTFVSPEVSREAVDTLLLQQVDHKLNGKICGDIPIAHKTGEDDHLSNDVGILFAPEPFILCFAGHDTDVYRWEDLMRRASWALWQIQL